MQNTSKIPDTSRRRFSLLIDQKPTILQQTQNQKTPRIFSEHDLDVNSNIRNILADRTEFRKLTQHYYQLYGINANTISISSLKDAISHFFKKLNLEFYNVCSVYQYIQDKFSNDEQLDYNQFQQTFYELLKIVERNLSAKNEIPFYRQNFVVERQLAAAEELESLYRFDERLGKGSFGEAYLVTELANGAKRVCKVINLSNALVPYEHVKVEIQIMKHLDHPNIIKIFEVYEGKNHIYIMMEYCEGGEIGARVAETIQNGAILTERYVADLMRQILETINYFHGQNVIHKDLKPENILFRSRDSETIKIIDFGLAEVFKNSNSLSNMAAGTLSYMAPEILDYIVTHKCDIWSAGCIFYQLVTGENVYTAPSIDSLIKKLREDPVSFAKFKNLPVSESSLDLLTHMLDKNYKTRYSAQECLMHTWMTSAKQTATLTKSMALNLKRYQHQSMLKKVLKNVSAHQLDIHGLQISQIQRVFRSLDLDGSGLLSKNEMAYGLMKLNFSSDEIVSIIKALDIDNSDTISYNEFLASCYKWHESELNKFWNIFKKLSKCPGDSVNVDSFLSLLMGTDNEKLQYTFLKDTEKLKRCIQSIDTNNDGIISWPEFLKYMTQ